MVLAALTHYPELWAAGIDIVGIANFRTFLENTGPWRRDLRIAEYGDPETDRELLERLSPINYVHRITAPLMVVHGANDPRVPVGEAEQIVAALRARHVPVVYLRYEDEGHGLSKLANRLDAYGKFSGSIRLKQVRGLACEVFSRSDLIVATDSGSEGTQRLSALDRRCTSQGVGAACG